MVRSSSSSSFNGDYLYDDNDGDADYNQYMLIPSWLQWHHCDDDDNDDHQYDENDNDIEDDNAAAAVAYDDDDDVMMTMSERGSVKTSSINHRISAACPQAELQNVIVIESSGGEDEEIMWVQTSLNWNNYIQLFNASVLLSSIFPQLIC